MSYDGPSPRHITYFPGRTDMCECEADIYFSGHGHDECPGLGDACVDCGDGCDLDFVDDGYCASLEEEEDEDDE